MNDFQSSVGFRSEPTTAADAVSIDSEREYIYDEGNPNQIVTHAPKERFRLGKFDVLSLVINRMIGTGIFVQPQAVMQGTGSTGAALLFWVAGMIYCLCGTHVYIEYGLNIPRYVINGIEQSVPRSGGDLNYLQYVFRKPAYRENTVLMITCIFGLAFIALGNMAGNSISFALRAMQAAGIEDPSNGAVRGIAIAVATFSCFIHAFSRRGGIWLNNILAMIKLGILLLIIITAIIVGAGGLPNTRNVIVENTSTANSFKDASTNAGGYAQAFLGIIFTFSGFEQPNYVLGEISRPRRKYPIAMITGVGLVIALYLAVNISYMVVVPKDDQINFNVAQRFFQLTFGQLSNNDQSNTGYRIFNALLALSSFGNIVVMTYTAARVKQEIAKEGILPWAKFFAQNTDMSLGRLLRWFQKKGVLASLFRLKWFSPEQHMEKTPVGALVLHFFSCVLLIFATYGMRPADAYTLLTGLSAYLVNSFFGTLLGLGILILRFRGPPQTMATEESSISDRAATPPTWRRMTGKHINPTLSVVAASIYMIGNLYPVVTKWVPTTIQFSGIQWYIVPAVCWGIVALGALWYLGFIAVAHRIDRKDQRVFVVEKKPEFEPADGESSSASDPESRGGAGLILVHETVFMSWVGKETIRSRKPSGFSDGRNEMQDARLNASPYAGTDFDGYFHHQASPGRDTPFR